MSRQPKIDSDFKFGLRPCSVDRAEEALPLAETALEWMLTPNARSSTSEPEFTPPVPLRAGGGGWRLIFRVGRGAGALGARGAKKRRPRLGRGALQNFGGADFQNRPFI